MSLKIVTLCMLILCGSAFGVRRQDTVSAGEELRRRKESDDRQKENNALLRKAARDEAAEEKRQQVHDLLAELRDDEVALRKAPEVRQHQQMIKIFLLTSFAVALVYTLYVTSDWNWRVITENFRY